MTQVTKPNNVFDRLSSALQTWRGEDNLNRHNTLGLTAPDTKSMRQMSFDGNGGGYAGGYGGYAEGITLDQVSAALRRYPNTKIDYANEVGDLSQSSLVMAAVNWLGRTLPEAPLQVIEYDGDGKATPLHGHPLSRLWRKPNDFFSGSTHCKAFALSWIANGNPYFLKVRNLRGQVIKLWYAPPWMLQPRYPLDGSQFISHYDYYVNGQTIQVAPEDVLHFRDGIDPYNTRCGLSSVASVLREIFSDNETSNYQALLMKNCGVPPFILSPRDGINMAGMKEEDKRKLKEEFIRRTTGDERGKPMLQTIGIQVDKLAFDPRLMDLKSLRRVPEERIAAVVGIPAMVLGFGAGLERSTFSNLEQAQEYAYESYLLPLLTYIEEELNLQLLPDFDQNPNLAVRFDISKIRALQEDQDNLFKRWGMAYQYGYARRSEARAAVGLPYEKKDEVYSTDVRRENARLTAGTSNAQPPPGQGQTDE